MTADRAALVWAMLQASQNATGDQIDKMMAALDLALEEAARVAETELMKDPWKDADYGWNAAIVEIAAAIRALKGKP